MLSVRGTSEDQDATCNRLRGGARVEGRFSVGAEGLSVSCGSLPAIVLVLELSLRLFGFKVLYSSH